MLQQNGGRFMVGSLRHFLNHRSSHDEDFLLAYLIACLCAFLLKRIPRAECCVTRRQGTHATIYPIPPSSSSDAIVSVHMMILHGSLSLSHITHSFTDLQQFSCASALLLNLFVANFGLFFFSTPPINRSFASRSTARRRRRK